MFDLFVAKDSLVRWSVPDLFVPIRALLTLVFWDAYDGCLMEQAEVNREELLDWTHSNVESDLLKSRASSEDKAQM